MTSSVWGPGAVELLKKCVAEGMNCSLIAAEIGHAFKVYVTRNAVIGKIARLGLGNTRPVAQQKAARRTHPQRNGGFSKRAFQDAQLKLKAIRKEHAQNIDEPAPELQREPISLFDLDHPDIRAKCRFPIDTIDGMMYCGAPTVALQSWCAYHFVRCTMPRGRHG